MEGSCELGSRGMPTNCWALEGGAWERPLVVAAAGLRKTKLLDGGAAGGGLSENWTYVVGFIRTRVCSPSCGGISGFP